MNVELDPIVMAAVAAVNVLALLLWACARVRVVLRRRPERSAGAATPALEPEPQASQPSEATLAASIARWRGGRAAPAAEARAMNAWIEETERAETRSRSAGSWR